MTPALGVCYYPEHWPETVWAADAAAMVQAGLSWVRIGEFAWSRIEPREDNFNWDWLDSAIETLGKAGLKIVLGTPTATPPRWMLTKHPDILACDKNGRPRKFGSRRHYCFSHEGYKLECDRIASKLGERYGKNPHIQSWQIDNEYGCHDTTLSYSQAAEAAFRVWLLEKYKSIEALNTAWGNVFWSMEYGNFEEIDLPNLTVTEANPAHVMDFRRFSSDQVGAFNKVQVDVLRQHTDAPLIHNYMGRITDFDHFAVGQDLDIASWDSYPLGFLEDRSDDGDDWKQRFSRQGDPDFAAFHHDLYRAIGDGRWWVMEQQPGPVNWAPYNPAPLPGMVRLWTWEAIAHGAEVVSYFRWRQAPFAQEQMHAGLQRADYGDSPAMAEVSKVAGEISDLISGDADESPVAIVFDYKSAWAWEIQPQGKDFDYFRLVFDMYRGLRRMGLSVDILPPDTQDFGSRKLVLIPGLMAWTDGLRLAIETFRGKLILGPRTGSKTEDFQIPAHLPPDMNALDVKVTAVESLRPGSAIRLENGGAFHIWREFVEAQSAIIESTTDGHPAVVESGSVQYICGWPDQQSFDRLLKSVAEMAGLTTQHMPGGLRCRDFGDFRLYVNYDNVSLVVDDREIPAANIMLVNRKNNNVLVGQN